MNRRLFLASFFGAVAARALPQTQDFGWAISAANQAQYLGFIPLNGLAFSHDGVVLDARGRVYKNPDDPTIDDHGHILCMNHVLNWANHNSDAERLRKSEPEAYRQIIDWGLAHAKKAMPRGRCMVAVYLECLPENNCPCGHNLAMHIVSHWPRCLSCACLEYTKH